MTNLTEYELLKHRYLSLLRTLDNMHVSAKYYAGGQWDVEIHGIDMAKEPDVTGFMYANCATIDNATVINLVRIGNTVRADIGSQSYQVEAGALISHLIDALHTAIVSAPAKA